MTLCPPLLVRVRARLRPVVPEGHASRSSCAFFLARLELVRVCSEQCTYVLREPSGLRCVFFFLKKKVIPQRIVLDEGIFSDQAENFDPQRIDPRDYVQTSPRLRISKNEDLTKKYTALCDACRKWIPFIHSYVHVCKQSVHQQTSIYGSDWMNKAIILCGPCL